jgi:hypothetical protein
MMTSSDRERLLSIIETKATMDDPISAFTIARELGKNGPDGQTEVNTHIRDLLADNLIVQKPRRGWPCYYLKSIQVEKKAPEPVEEMHDIVPKAEDYAEDDEADEDLNEQPKLAEVKEEEPASEPIKAKEEKLKELRKTVDDRDAFDAKVKELYADHTWTEIAEILKVDRKAINRAIARLNYRKELDPKQLQVKGKAAAEPSHFKECRFGCGKKLAPQGIWRHEMYCPKRPADQPRVRETVMVAAEEAKLPYLGPRVANALKTGPKEEILAAVQEATLKLQASNASKRYKLNIHQSDIVITEGTLEHWVEELMAHGVKEISIKEVS